MIKVTVDGYLGKDPHVQTIGDAKVVVLSIASRHNQSRHADWITGSVWDKRLQTFVLDTFRKGDKVIAFGLVSKLSVYYSEGKQKPGMDIFVNAISFAEVTKETTRNE